MGWGRPAGTWDTGARTSVDGQPPEFQSPARVSEYSPDQPRDYHGRWAPGDDDTPQAAAGSTAGVMARLRNVLGDKRLDIRTDTPAMMKQAAELAHAIETMPTWVQSIMRAGVPTLHNMTPKDAYPYVAGSGLTPLDMMETAAFLHDKTGDIFAVDLLTKPQVERVAARGVPWSTEVITHEVGHTAQELFPKIFRRFVEAFWGDRQFQKYAAGSTPKHGWTDKWGPKGQGSVSVYGDTAPNEDWAETFAMHALNPDALEKKDAARASFMRRVEAQAKLTLVGAPSQLRHSAAKREAIVSMNPPFRVPVDPFRQLRRMGVPNNPGRYMAVTPPIASRVVSREVSADDCAAGGGHWRTLAHGPVCIGGSGDPDAANKKIDTLMTQYDAWGPAMMAARDKMEKEIAALPNGKKILFDLERATSAWTGADYRGHSMMRNAMNEFLSQPWYAEYHAWSVNKLKEMTGTDAITLWRGQYGPAWVKTVKDAQAAGKPVVEFQAKDMMSWTTSREQGDQYGRSEDVPPSILTPPGERRAPSEPTPAFSMVVPLNQVILTSLTDPFWPSSHEHEMVVLHRTNGPAPKIRVRIGKGQTVESYRSNVYYSEYVVPDEQTNFAYMRAKKPHTEYRTRERYEPGWVGVKLPWLKDVLRERELVDCGKGGDGHWVTKGGQPICIKDGYRHEMEEMNKPWQAPPKPIGKGRRPGGYSANGLTNGLNGDLGEALVFANYDLKSAHPGSRKGRLDVLHESGRAFELKTTLVESTEYKIRMQKHEQAEKEDYAKTMKLRGGSMINVMDWRFDKKTMTMNKRGTMWTYWRDGIGHYGLSPSGKQGPWHFIGRVSFVVPSEYLDRARDEISKARAEGRLTKTGVFLQRRGGK